MNRTISSSDSSAQDSSVGSTNPTSLAHVSTWYLEELLSAVIPFVAPAKDETLVKLLSESILLQRVSVDVLFKDFTEPQQASISELVELITLFLHSTDQQSTFHQKMVKLYKDDAYVGDLYPDVSMIVYTCYQLMLQVYQILLGDLAKLTADSLAVLEQQEQFPPKYDPYYSDVVLLCSTVFTDDESYLGDVLINLRLPSAPLNRLRALKQAAKAMQLICVMNGFTSARWNEDRSTGADALQQLSDLFTFEPRLD